MTELERHLLNALEQLQQDYMQRLNEWENAFVELQKMFSLTQRDNAMLNGRVMQARFRCIFWDNGWFGGTGNALQSDLAENTGTR
ncbi:MbeD family mobilization/exclusion protein [Escherichia coli]